MPVWLIIVLGLLVLVGGGVAVAAPAPVAKPSESNPSNWAYWLKKARTQTTQKKQVYRLALVDCGLYDYFKNNLGLPAIAWAAIAAWESGWGTSYAARFYNNLTGISYKDTITRLMRPYRYASLGEYRAGLTKMLELSRYQVARQTSDPKQHVRELWKAGYNSSTTWRDGVLTLIGEMQQLGLA